MTNDKIRRLFQSELQVANIGVQSFYETLKEQGCKAVHLNWRPAAGGDKKLLDMLALLK